MEPSKDPTLAPPGVLTLMSNDYLTYWLFIPSVPCSGPRPSMLFLHGAGGVNNPSNVRSQSLTRMLGSPSYASKIPHIIITPIAPQRDWTQHTSKVLTLLDSLIESLNLDSTKITLSGQSMGGHGVWNLAQQYPTRWSTIIPICGYVNRSDPTSLPSTFSLTEFRSLNIWLFHAEDDSVVSVQHSDNIVSSLRALGASDNLKYTRYASGISPPCKTKVKDLVGHGCYELAFKEEELWKWIESKW
ncbi:hypothetical protein TrVE_jg394 [Triparma verrucosa]|uniref:Phospholipase/carboxylesterase/thioesterase domain-containing protein n=1 Tax=Triparma verrucosa TaxID=1606542 RepID=A0A9W7F7W2_9STRA|nr:hypothetical protein TrVE_jg394 [Triparma verrucosa]